MQARVPGSPYPTCSGGLNSTSTLYVYNTDSGSADDAFTVQSLQGVLSKTTPRVYHYSSGSDYVLWLNVTVSTFGARLNSTFESDAAGLVAFFAPHLSGYVLVDDSDNSTNVGIAAAAAADVIIVTTANEALATSAGLPLRWDVRGKDLAWALATFNGTGGFAYSRTVTVLQVSVEWGHTPPPLLIDAAPLTHTRRNPARPAAWATTRSRLARCSGGRTT